jgi:hypothetical protein
VLRAAIVLMRGVPRGDAGAVGCLHIGDGVVLRAAIVVLRGVPRGDAGAVGCSHVGTWVCPTVLTSGQAVSAASGKLINRGAVRGGDGFRSTSADSVTLCSSCAGTSVDARCCS